VEAGWVRRATRAGVAAAVVAATALTVLFVTPAPATAVTSTPVADAYVRADQTTTNFGTSTQLSVDASPVITSYLRFDVTGLAGPPAQATLRLFSRSTQTTPIKVYAVGDTSWSETAVTWDLRPTLGPLLASSPAQTSGAWVDIDVTAGITANGLVSFALDTGSTAAKTLDSREGANPPQLVVTPSPPTNGDPVLAVAGDVACGPLDPDYNGGVGTATACHQAATSDLILQMGPAAVLMLGDAQYNSGALADFNAAYDPSWGRIKSITKPVVGNHEYGTTGAGGYFDYFGDAATPRQPGCRTGCDAYYSFDVGTWHIAVINTECTRINVGAGCAVGSPQDLWLKSDLAAHPTSCTLVIGHRPRWSSNSFASAEIAPLVDDMVAGGVDLLMTGHAHSYERFAPQDAAGVASANGIREIVVGTGGAFFTGFGTVVANSLVHKPSIFGVMRLTLHPTSYDWAFVSDPTTPFADAGTGTCH
jgi:hypothetical protein